MTVTNPMVLEQLRALRASIAVTSDPLRRSYLVREYMSWLLEDCQHSPKKYSNSDALDLIRDVATEFKQDYKFVRSKDEAGGGIILVLTKSPEEFWNYEQNKGVVQVGADGQYLGFVARSHGADTIQGSKAF